MPHRSIVPLALGFLIYKFLRSTLSGVAAKIGLPFA